jgi:hypothetical protein
MWSPRAYASPSITVEDRDEPVREKGLVHGSDKAKLTLERRRNEGCSWIGVDGEEMKTFPTLIAGFLVKLVDNISYYNMKLRR